MLGYDMSWAAFNVVEVISNSRFTNKRVGYLAACISFDESTDVIMLCTNLIKKDMGGKTQYETSIALNCLANICTADLARDLAADVVAMLNSSRPYIRKRALLVLYRVFLKFPEALRPAFPRLKDKLKDPDESVVGSAVSVICELASKNPKNYVNLAPTLFQILTTSNNNWMLIKLIKLFASLCPYEPRLPKKLVDPLSKILNSTPPMSLLYECIQTCAKGLSDNLPLIRLCVQKLRLFVENHDQNLKYLGLLALHQIMQIHPKLVAEHRDLVFACFDDPDISIRLRAIDLITGMVSKQNIADIVAKLLDHIERSEGSYRDKLVEKILEICSGEPTAPFKFITDFEWYINVLTDLTRFPSKHGKEVAAQFLDVVIRVKVVRPYAVKVMLEMLTDSRLLLDPVEGGPCEALYAAAFCVGEYMRNKGFYKQAIEAMLQPAALALPSNILAVYMQNAVKLFACGCAEANADELVSLLEERLQPFARAQHLEVQERACYALEIVTLFKEFRGEGLGTELLNLFTDPLNPVAPKAQRKVPVPEGLDLDTWLHEPPVIEPDPEDDLGMYANTPGDDDDWGKEEEAGHTYAGTSPPARDRHAGDPFYLSKGTSQAPKRLEESGSDLPPMVDLTGEDLGKIIAFTPRPSECRQSTRKRSATWTPQRRQAHGDFDYNRGP